MEIDQQIKLLEEQVGEIKGIRNLSHRDSRFTTWKKRTLSHLQNIFSDGSEYVRRFEKLTFQEPGFGARGGAGTSYEDMGGSFVHDLDRAKTILEDGIEALRRLRPPKQQEKPTPKEVPAEESLPEESESDDLFFERAILEKTLSEEPVAETTPGEDLTTAEELFKPSYQESEPPLEELIKGSRGEGEPSPKSQSVEEVVGYVSSLLYHYISLEENPQTKKALQGLRGELENPKRSKEGIMKALKASWEEGKDVLVDIIARVFAKKQ